MIWIFPSNVFNKINFTKKTTITFCLEQLVASTNPEALKKVIVVKLIKKQVEQPLGLE